MDTTIAYMLLVRGQIRTRKKNRQTTMIEVHLTLSTKSESRAKLGYQ